MPTPSSEGQGSIVVESIDDRPTWLKASAEFVNMSVKNLPKLGPWAVETAIVCAVAASGDSDRAFLTATALQAMNLGLALKQFKDRREAGTEIEENFLSTISDVFAPMAFMAFGIAVGSNSWVQENINNFIGWAGSEMTKYAESHGGAGGHRGIGVNDIPKSESPAVSLSPDPILSDGSVVTTLDTGTTASDIWGNATDYPLRLLNTITGGTWPYLIPSGVVLAIVFRSWFGDRSEN